MSDKLFTHVTHCSYYTPTGKLHFQYNNFIAVNITLASYEHPLIEATTLPLNSIPTSSSKKIVQSISMMFAMFGSAQCLPVHSNSPYQVPLLNPDTKSINIVGNAWYIFDYQSQYTLHSQIDLM